MVCVLCGNDIEIGDFCDRCFQLIDVGMEIENIAVIVRSL